MGLLCLVEIGFHMIFCSVVLKYSFFNTYSSSQFIISESSFFCIFSILSLTSCVTLDIQLNVLRPQFPQLQDAVDNLVAKSFSSLQSLCHYGLYFATVHLFLGAIKEHFKRKQYKCRHLQVENILQKRKKMTMSR